MPLQFQNTWYTFQKGLQQKIDPLLLSPPYLLKAQNVVFTKSGSVQKRTGYEKLATLSTPITSLSDFDNTIVVQDSSSIFGYSDQTTTFSNLGDKLPAKFTHQEIIRDKYENINCDSYQHNGLYTVVAWQSNDAASRVKYSVVDTDGVTIVHDEVVAETAKNPRVVAAGNNIWIVYVDTGDSSINARRVPLSSPATLGSEIELVAGADVAATEIYDVSGIPEISAIIVAWSHNTPGISMKYFDDLGDAGAGVATNGFPTTTDVSSSVPLTVLRVTPGVDASTNVKFLLNYDLVADIKNLIIDFGLQTDVAEAAFQVITNVERIGTTFDADNNAWVVMNQTVDANVNLNNIYKGIVKHDDGAITVASAIYQKGCTLYSDPVASGDNLYFWCLHESDIQPTYLFFKDEINDTDGAADGYKDSVSEPVLIGKHLAGIAGTAQRSNHVCKDTFAVPMNKRNHFTSEDGAITFNNQGVILLDVTVESMTRASIAQVGRTSLVTGSLSQTFDKHQLVEHGFNIFPETLSGAQSGAAGVADGTYSYLATYEWEDSNGDIHESAPSSPYSFTVTGGPRNVTVTIPTNRITTKSGVIVHLYRTTNGGTIYYRVNDSGSGFTFNDKTADTVDIVDAIDDATLVGRPQIYITGGTLDNIAPPYCSTAVMHKGRIFAAGEPNNPSRLWFSSVYTAGEGLQFNELLTVNVEYGAGGDITALSSLDDNLVIFKKDSIFLMGGLGPDRAGNQNDYDARKINTDVGCDSPFSIVKTPMGVIFKSDKGIYMLNRQLEVTYVGQQVENFNDSDVLSATLNADENHVRFVLSTGEVLYYNYFHDAWSEFTNYFASSAVVRSADGLFYHADSDGKLYRQTSTFQDAGSSIRMKIRTGWMTFGSQLQLKRVRYAGLLGKRLEDHRITWKIYKDFSDVVDERFTFDVTSGDASYGSYPSWGAASFYGTDANSWGENIDWGSDSFWGGASTDVMEYRHHIKQQKCTAISFEISDDSFGTGTGPAFTLVGFHLEWAMKNGVKRNQARTV